MSMPRGALLKLSSVSAKRWPAAAKAPVCMVLSLDVLPAFATTLHANTGMSEPRGRLARWSVSLRAVLAASLGAHRKAQHARVCFAGGRYFSRQRQLRECRCSARSAKPLAESSLGNCMLGVWLCPSRSRAPGGTRGGTGCKGAHHRSRYSPFRTLVRSAPPNHGEVMRGPCQRKGIRSKRDQIPPPRHSE